MRYGFSKTWRTIWRSCFTAALPMLASGCVFYAAEGQGSLSRDQLAAELGGDITPDEAAALVETAAEEADFFQSNRRVKLAGRPYRMTTATHGVWAALIASPTETWVHLKPDPEKGDGGRELITHDQGFGVLSPLYLRSEGAVYDVKTGMAIGASRSTAITLLNWVHSGVGAEQKTILDPAIELEAVKIKKQSSVCLLAGALAWGEVNGRRYLQILWIPIPIGNTETY